MKPWNRVMADVLDDLTWHLTFFWDNEQVARMTAPGDASMLDVLRVQMQSAMPNKPEPEEEPKK